MVSYTPGFVTQMTGKINTKCYRYATQFVDQAEKYTYIHLQKFSDAEETIKGKLIFKKEACNKGILVKAYHTDNGIFLAKKGVQDFFQRTKS